MEVCPQFGSAHKTMAHFRICRIVNVTFHDTKATMKTMMLKQIHLNAKRNALQL
jgi:hypothetical protein